MAVGGFMQSINWTQIIIFVMTFFFGIIAYFLNRIFKTVDDVNKRGQRQETEQEVVKTKVAEMEKTVAKHGEKISKIDLDFARLLSEHEMISSRCNMGLSNGINRNNQ